MATATTTEEKPTEETTEEKPTKETPKAKTKGRLYAHSNIHHGKGDGTHVVIAHGEEVKGLSDEDLEPMIEAGSVRSYPPVKGVEDAAETIAAKDERIAELEAALKAAQAAAPKS